MYSLSPDVTEIPVFSKTAKVKPLMPTFSELQWGI